jgi:hypothetical protein
MLWSYCLSIIRLAWVKAAISCGGGDEAIVGLWHLLCAGLAFVSIGSISSTTKPLLCSSEIKTPRLRALYLATMALRASGASPKPQ